MTLEDISTTFDILYNNISSGQAPGLTEGEKSTFLTKAYFEIVKNYFNSKGNKYLEGIEDSAKRQADFEHLIVFNEINAVSDTNYLGRTVKTLSFEDEYIALLDEFVKVSFIEKGETKFKFLTVIPLSSSEYVRLMRKPFNYPSKNTVWKVAVGDNKFMFITSPSETFTSYEVRYVKVPDNIDLEGDNDVAASDSLMQEIIQRAVEIAKNAWEGNLETTLKLGERSE
jgi:hypothetical protein